MIKNISELTEEDKKRFLIATKRAMEKEQGVSWNIIEKCIQDDIDATFDDDRYAKRDFASPGYAGDAAHAREYFEWDKKHEKPSLIDYMLWSIQFVTKSEYVEI